MAKAIREQDTACQLVFVTVSADHALESYEVYAAGYLLKPYTKEDLTETLAVSYTHLDVYKRQAVSRTFLCLLSQLASRYGCEA